MGNFTYNATPHMTDYAGWGRLNSLADKSMAVITATPLDNRTNRYYYGIAELYLASVDLSSATSPVVDLYLVPSADGTNYANVTATPPPSNYMAGIFNIEETAANHRSVIEHVILDPLKYKPTIYNRTGAALASPGNTLKIGTFTDYTI